MPLRSKTLYLKNETQEYRSLIDALFKLPEVRYAAIIDSYGEKYSGGMKPGVRSVSTDEAENRLQLQAVIILKMAENYENITGKLHYSTIRWEKVRAIFFLLASDRALAITCFIESPNESFLNIEKLVNDWKKQTPTA